MLVHTLGFSTTRRKGGSPNRNPVEQDQTVEPVQGTKLNQTKPKKLLVEPLKIKHHRRGKRNSIKVYKKNFKWIGNNIAGAQSKWATLKRLVSIKTPAILTLQETKFQIAGKHRLDGYVVYEHLRTKNLLVEEY